MSSRDGEICHLDFSADESAPPHAISAAADDLASRMADGHGKSPPALTFLIVVTIISRQHYDTGRTGNVVALFRCRSAALFIHFSALGITARFYLFFAIGHPSRNGFIDSTGPLARHHLASGGIT